MVEHILPPSSNTLSHKKKIHGVTPSPIHSKIYVLFLAQSYTQSPSFVKIRLVSFVQSCLQANGQKQSTPKA